MAYFGSYSILQMSNAADAAAVAYDGFSAGAMPNGWKSIVPSKKSGFQNGQFEGEFFVNDDAAASVVRKGKELIVAFRGTDDPNDLIDDASLLFVKNYFEEFDSLLTSVAKFSKKEGLNVTFAGHSLGAAAVNMVADNAAKNWGGAFKNSNFVGFESPYVSSQNQKLFNFGASNDFVYGLLPPGIDEARGLSHTYFSTEVGDLTVAGTEAHSLRIAQRYLGNLQLVKTEIGIDLVKDLSPDSFVIFDAASRQLDAGAVSVSGQDKLWIIGEGATTNPSPGNINDNILGSNPANNPSKADWIITLDGNDTISARGGNDHIWAGKGSDTVDGGQGDDTAYLDYQKEAVTLTYNRSATSMSVATASGTDTYSGIEAYVFSDSSDTVRVAGDAVAYLQVPYSGIEALYFGGKGDDVFLLAQDQAVIDAGAGNDTFAAEALLPRNVWGEYEADGILQAQIFVLNFEDGKDEIDLSKFDADWTTAGTQRFKFLEYKKYNGDDGLSDLESGATSDSRPGYVTVYDDNNGHTRIILNTDDDNFREVEIILINHQGNVATDLIL